MQDIHNQWNEFLSCRKLLGSTCYHSGHHTLVTLSCYKNTLAKTLWQVISFSQSTVIIVSDSWPYYVLVPICLSLFFHLARSKSVIPGEGSPGSSRSGSRRSMEKPLKTGWLKKQRSFVKNWQLRFFVLRGNVLTYHKDDKESALQVWETQIYSV